MTGNSARTRRRLGWPRSRLAEVVRNALAAAVTLKREGAPMMLIDDRAPPPPEEGLPPWEPNWRVWWRLALAVALGAAAIWTTGLAEVIAAFGALIAGCSAATTAIDYSGGLREWRQ